MRQKEFFERIAHKWDETAVHDERKIKFCMENIGIKKGDRILDVGTGTGVLMPFLHEYAGVEGKIDAVDYSPAMIGIAVEKWKYDNLNFICSDIMEYISKEKYNIIVCYSVFPHFRDKKRVLKKLYGMLESGGKIVVFHSQSRDEINNLHKHAGDEVKEDVLPEADKVAGIFRKTGLEVADITDNDEMYLIVGLKSEN